ncbi:3-isopropylmalate dehydratase [Kitasatospora sp. NBC_00315]|uniref:LeuD/DmdB family oxidoreductase small subunit n=1 Tax=Kitasatospora sp. NBC_00315 TaxID=2975963 RepID=UPI00325196D1
MSLTGTVFRLPADTWDDVNTDVMLPGAYLRLPEEQLGDHAFDGVLPNFRERLAGATVLVGGSNLGCGSSREQAPKALLGAGVQVIVARSFGSIFFRNALNLGLGLLRVDEPQGLEALRTGVGVSVNLADGLLRTDAGEEVQGRPLGGYLQRIVDAGGILRLLADQSGALA